MVADGGAVKDVQMMRAVRVGLVCVLAFSGDPAFAAGAVDPGKLTRYELPGYTLIAADNGQLRRDVAKLPRLKHALEEMTGRKVKPTGIPTVVYVVPGAIWEKYLEPAPVLASEFVPTRFTNYILASNTSVDQRRLFHEHTHLYVYNQMPGVYPLWFDEGLAVMMANAQFTGTEVNILPPGHDDRGGWIPTAKVLRATKNSPEYLDQAQLFSIHFQSNAMVYRALIDDKEFGQQVLKYLEAVNNVATPDQAETMLGNIDELDSKMRGYVNDTNRKRVQMDVPGIADLTLPAGTAVSTLDSLLGIATVCLDAGIHLDRVHELLDSAAEPGGGKRVIALRARVAARLANDTELEKNLAILTKDAGDLPSVRAAGLALYERAQTLDASSATRAELSARSLPLLDRSLASRVDDPEAAWAFAMQAADLEKDMDAALQRLLPMFERLPENPDISLAAGRLLYAKGDPNLKPYATAVLRYSNSLEHKRWAAQRITELKKKLAEAK
jgi:hypothetical protein